MFFFLHVCVLKLTISVLQDGFEIGTTLLHFMLGL